MKLRTLPVCANSDFMQETSGANLVQELSTLFVGHWLTDTSNFAAFVFQNMPDLNWAGFYFDDSKLLRLGPFVGKPACTEIAYNRGVCGASFTKRESLIVADVHAFPGHIACDAASNAELVVPLMIDGECFGVFDLDSPTKNRFTEKDRMAIEEWLTLLAKAVPKSQWQRRPWQI